MRRLATTLDVLVVVLLTTAALIAWTGGGRVAVAGIIVSLHGWLRPLAGASVLFGASQAIRVGYQRRSPSEVVQRFALLLTAACVTTALAWTALYINIAVGGLDSYAYASFAELLSHGQLSRVMPDLPWLAVDHPALVVGPLGFIPSTDGHRLVNEFPPGLPILLAAARLVAGAGAVYWVPWICQIALVLVVCQIAKDCYGALTAGLAAALMAADPIASAYAMQTMSDVPAALFTVVAVYAMAARRNPAPVVAGLAASMAILIRPPLLLPLAVLGAIALRRTPRAAWTMAAWTLPGFLGLMAIQDVLYGSPFVSGHGSAGYLFTTATLAHNLGVHAKWFLIVQTPLAVPALWLGWRTDRPFAVGVFAVAFAEALPYLVYSVPFSDWWMQRFLLPGIAVLIPVAAEGVARLLRRIPQPAVAQLGVAVVSLAAVAGSGYWLVSQGVPSLAFSETKYPRVGNWFNANSTPESVVFASLHGGSINYYSGRLTLRWDRMDPDQMVRTLDGLAARGLSAYVVLDSYEQELFERRFAVVNPQLKVEPVDRVFATIIATIRRR